MNLNKALELAAIHHNGQQDKNGEDYILHVLAVLNNVEKMFIRNYSLRLSDEEQNHLRITAVLHDILEDTPLSRDYLASEGFPKPVLDALDLLTKLPGEGRMENARRLKHNQLAVRVKVADLTHNMDLNRMTWRQIPITETDRARKREYRQVFDYLTEGKHHE